MSAGSYAKQITTNDLLRMTDDTGDQEILQILGITNSGTVLITQDRFPKKKRVQGRLVTERNPPRHQYTVTDLIASQGTITVLQGNPPWTVTFGGSFFASQTTNAGSSDNLLLLSATKATILKTLIVNAAAGGSRGPAALTDNAPLPNVLGSIGSKTVAGGTLGDLLDREVAVPANDRIGLKGTSTPGDVLYASWIQP